MYISLFGRLVGHKAVDQKTKIEESEWNRSNKGGKEAKIFFADAFGEPGTVVIPFLYAYIADSAVVDSFRDEYFANVAIAVFNFYYVLLG